ncbi:type II toxin-antitoxin system ParD family antitoxin [Alteromonadaceae bacterium BrNp21-10]|nr:type II toxin-antitoxin system ParD family antitoxin [Alteromonadaceae bacterium BrNp21-10]
MPRNTSVTLGEHFDSFVESKVREGRYGSTSEAIRAGLRLLEEKETKLDRLKAVLSAGEAQLNNGLGVDGDTFMNDLIDA